LQLVARIKRLWEDSKDLEAGEVSYKGDYIHINDESAEADGIYAVRNGREICDLDKQSKEFMRTPYDMVQVNHGESPNPRKAENW
jgi:hypothetical protein